MSQKEVKESGVRARIGGASIAWVTLYGALCGVTALVPIFPYVGGGGYVPLATPFSAIAPLLLGSWGGIVAAIIGGLIGMFIAPAAFPLQLVDVIIGGAAPAIFVALAINNDRYWKITVPVFALVGLFGILFPYYVPGAAAGFGQPPQPLYLLLTAIYWLPPLIITATPLGIRYVPQWARQTDRVKRYIGIFLAMLAGMLIWWIPWTRPYWYVFNYSVDLGIATHIGYSWWVPALTAITTVITIPIIEALARSGLPKPEGALW